MGLADNTGRGGIYIYIYIYKSVSFIRARVHGGIIYHPHPSRACPPRVNVRFDSKVFFPVERFSLAGRVFIDEPVSSRIERIPERGKIFFCVVHVCVCVEVVGILSRIGGFRKFFLDSKESSLLGWIFSVINPRSFERICFQIHFPFENWK